MISMITFKKRNNGHKEREHQFPPIVFILFK
nr:MAG TPA: hypothetical protein [Caudoviricetes sp.]